MQEAQYRACSQIGRNAYATIGAGMCTAGSPWGTITAANSSDQVGRNLADHPISLVYGITDDPVYGYRGPLSTSGIESLRDGTFRQYRGACRMGPARAT
jgi:hypothetical protein